MKPIRFHCTTNIHLSLEEAYLDGLSHDRAREIIESVMVNGKMWCRPSDVKGNWIISDTTINPDEIPNLVAVIEDAIFKEMQINDA